MPDGSNIGPEIQGGPDPKKLEQSARFIRRARHALVDYSDARELLNEGRFSEEEMRQNSAEIGATDWNYTLTRVSSEFLDLLVERKPRKKGTGIISEEIRVSYGDQPAYNYTKTFETGNDDENVTSAEDEARARRKVRRFLEDMEGDLLPPQPTKHK